MPLTRLNFNIYGYTPTLAICITFVSLFVLCTAAHFLEGLYLKRRLWWMIPTAVVCGLGEILGWGARLWSAKNPYLLEPYLIQIVATILSPTFLITANFIILGILIRTLGPEYSRLKPMMYSVVFCSADIVALTVQAVGGAKAALTVTKGTSPEQGGHIMLGGICFQMASIVLFVTLMVGFVVRCWFDKPFQNREPAEKAGNRAALQTRNIKLMLFSILLSSALIFIRSVYRTIELTDGWTGSIIQNETLFNVFDGLMILLATFTLNVLHPGRLLAQNTW